MAGGAFRGLMNQIQQPQPMEAMPVHHILEKDPATGEVFGSDWLSKATAERDRLLAKAQDRNHSRTARNHAASLAAELTRSIGEEDLYHNRDQEEDDTMKDTQGVAAVEGEKGRIRGGTRESGITPNAAKKQGWTPPPGRRY